MSIEAINPLAIPLTKLGKAPDNISESRKKATESPVVDQAAAKQIQPEEMLSQIKALTEDGLYSVRFENDERSKELVVKIVDRENDKVIRQVPAEEVLDLKVALQDLRGNIVDTQS
jgi:flagellar protein FlaG